MRDDPDFDRLRQLQAEGRSRLRVSVQPAAAGSPSFLEVRAEDGQCLLRVSYGRAEDAKQAAAAFSMVLERMVSIEA